MKKILGVFFIILGGLGGLVPIIPGFLFFFAGLALLSPKLEAKIKAIHNRYKTHKSLKIAAKELFNELTPDWLKKKININCEQ